MVNDCPFNLTVRPEKRAMQRIWKKRERQNQMAFMNLACIYGEIQAIVGATVPELAALTLTPLTEETRETDEKDDAEVA